MKSYIQGLITGSVLVFSFMVLTGQKSESNEYVINGKTITKNESNEIVIDGKIITSLEEFNLATRTSHIDSDCCDLSHIEMKLRSIEDKVGKMYNKISSPLFGKKIGGFSKMYE